jgi:hypothetical protein
MTRIKTISAIAILSAAIATPVLAQDAGPIGPGSRYGLEPQPGPTYYQSYGESDAPFLAPRHYRHGFNGRDHSRVGGQSPSLKPPS